MKEEKFVKFIKKIIKDYKNILGLNLYDIDIEKDEEYYLALRFNYPYQDTTLYYSDKAVNNFHKGELNKYRILTDLYNLLINK